MGAGAARRRGGLRRGEDGSWTYRAADRGGRLTLSDGAVLEVDAIFAGALELPGD